MLRGGARMAQDILKSLLIMLAYLLGLVGGLAWRAIQVFVGTYQSAEWKVRRAGAVADLNAAVLAAAVILLYASRDAFRDAQTWTSHQARLSQLSVETVVACNTFDQKPFNGTLNHDLTFRCESVDGHSTVLPLEIDTTGKQQVNVNQTLKILDVLNGCHAYSWGFGFSGKRTTRSWSASLDKKA